MKPYENIRKNPINLALAKEIVKLANKGFTEGMGHPEPGMMCVEAAVCYAMGLDHSDNPPCVNPQVRNFKTCLNDANGWKSNSSRGRGLKKLAIAQLGSKKCDGFSNFMEKALFDYFIDKMFRRFFRKLILQKLSPKSRNLII